MQSYCAYNMLIGIQKKFIQHADSFISRRNRTILTMCLRRSQEIIAQSYTRLVTHNIVAHITLTIRFVLKKTCVACLLLQMRRTFESQTYTIVAYVTLINNVFPSFSKKT